jgi:hypothetical protein
MIRNPNSVELNKIENKNIGMKKKHLFLPFRYILILFIPIISSMSSYAQATPVFADPALGSFDVTNLSDVSVDANSLSINSIYKIKLDVFNLSLTSAIPPGTCYVDIGLGTKFILDPAVTANATVLNNYLSNAPLSNYFSFSYITTGAQPKIRCTITNALPFDFYGQFIFDLKANTQGTSNVTGNFFIGNNNPSFVLSDDNSGNNTAALQYTITSVVPVTITDFKAYNKDCNINVNWSVGQETNVLKYDIELSKDGTNFAKIGYLKAENKNKYDTSIAIFDQIKSPTLFVRLKSVDNNGTFKYSPIVTVTGICKTAIKEQAYCYPNPILKDQQITIASKEESFNGIYQLTVIDAMGKTYMNKQFVLDSAYSFKFSIKNELAAGKYFMILHKDEKTPNIILQFLKE